MGPSPEPGGLGCLREVDIKVLILPVELNPSTASLADFYPAKVETLTQHALALLVRFEAMLEG